MTPEDIARGDRLNAAWAALDRDFERAAEALARATGLAIDVAEAEVALRAVRLVARRGPLSIGRLRDLIACAFVEETR